jgi:hypothetical protein
MERDYHIQMSWENGTWNGLFSKPEGDYWFVGMDKLQDMLEQEAALVAQMAPAGRTAPQSSGVPEEIQ